MINQKRGLSAVIVTVLIILLALAAVAIVWAAVRPALSGAGDQIQGTQDCLNLNLQVTACSATAAVGSGGSALVTVRRNVGGGTSLNNLRLIVNGQGFDTDGTEATPAGAPEVLESQQYTISTGISGLVATNPVNVEVGGILNDGTVCESISQPTTCTVA